MPHYLEMTHLIRQLSVDGFDAAHHLLGQLVDLLLAWPVFGDFLQHQTGVLGKTVLS
jgi:hypothetical protein